MTAAPPLAFPTGRALAGWWRQLLPYRPRSLWVGHLLLHRVEAPVSVSRPVPLDRLDALVLRSLDAAPTATLLDARLHLGAPFVGRLLEGLRGEGLAERGPQGDWSVTARGRQALARGEYRQTRGERATFHFVEGDRPGRPPAFLAVRGTAAAPWPAAEGWEFRREVLEECVGRPAEWKRRHGFPEEIDQAPGGGLPAWQAVLVDRPVRLPAALVMAPGDGGARLLGFAARAEGWTLQAEEPAFALAEEGWPEAFPELAEEPPPEAWRLAWQAWCHGRNLPAGDVAACRLERREHRLVVEAPPRLVERLRAGHGDVFKGEVWLLAGEGRYRAAAQAELAAQTSS